MEPKATEAVYAALTEQHAERTAPEVAATTGIGEPDVRAVLESLAADRKAVAISSDGFLSDIAWKRVRETAVRALAAFHKRHPYKRRAPDSDLRPALAKAATVRDFLALKAALEGAGVIQREPGGARLPEFAVELPPRWESAAAEMLAVFVGGGLTDPPWPGNFRAHYPRDVPVDAVLDALCEQGRLIRLVDDLYLAPESVEKAKETVRSLADAGTPISVGAVRDATGSSRRVVVPLLEALDKQGFTVRHDETRMIRTEGDPKSG